MGWPGPDFYRGWPGKRPLLLGVQNVPQSVEVSRAEGKANTYNVYENFEAGRQYIQMDVANNTEGSLKILAIRIPNPSPAPAKD